MWLLYIVLTIGNPHKTDFETVSVRTVVYSTQALCEEQRKFLLASASVNKDYSHALYEHFSCIPKGQE